MREQYYTNIFLFLALTTTQKIKSNVSRETLLFICKFVYRTV